MGVQVVDRESLPPLLLARANYGLLAKALKAGKAIVVQGSAQRVSKMRRRLSEMLGEPVVSIIVYPEEEGASSLRKVYILIRERDLLGVEGGGVEEGAPEDA
ncbi:MAG: hypothetical protein QW324_08680 [Thermofilaceae archaeon]